MFKVAVVDPDPGSLQATAGLLARNGHVVSVACFSGYGSFLNEIRKGEVHVAFIRVGRPELPGLTAARMILAVSPATMVVLMSDSESYAVAAFEEGASGYLLLPAGQKDLDGVMENIRKRGNRMF